ncbi:MAG: alginate export family protein [Novosphingobium sp.]
MKKYLIAAAALAAPVALARPALADAPAHHFGDPIKIGDGVTLDPIIDARLRWEHVDQPATDADAVTLRLRGGFEIKHAPSHLALLAEAEGTVAPGNDYNAFPFAVATSQRRTQYSVVADPENIELNRLQLQYKGKAVTVTVGRQRINLDDQRFVGSVGWRQNEQTFDAARIEAKLGPVSLDGTYSISQRTIFGYDAGPRTAYDGNFVFLGAGAKLGPVNVKAFAYLLDYDLDEQAGALATALADTQTYGLRANTSLPLSKRVKLNLAASYARQSDMTGSGPKFGADYVAAEGALAFYGFTATVGYELLGSDAAAAGGAGRAFQTPMATLHKFNGWADLFLTTPNSGLQDIYGGISYGFPKVKFVKGLNAQVTYHQFHSDTGGVDFGHEWDASIGFKTGRIAWLAKYADYTARGFGTDTSKFWLQAEVAF